MGLLVLSPRTEKRKEFIINALYFVVVALIVFACLKYAVSWFMPFIIGFVIAFLSKPLVAALCKIPHMNRKFAATVVLIFEYALIIFLIWILGSKIYDSLKDIFTKLPQYYDSSILPFFETVAKMLDDLSSKISPQTLEEIYAMIENASDTIRTYIIRLSSSAVSGLAGLTAKIPFFFISFVFTILASVFINLNYDVVVDFIKKQLPPKGRVLLRDAKAHVGKTIIGYLRAYVIIWMITFSELSIGLSILRIENAIGLAAIIALADILPVVGTGGILLPWAIVAVIMQNYFLAVGLVILYLIIMAVRNFTEPKIVGDQLGLNPLVTIIAIYLGYRLMGLSGMIILPIITNILVGLQKSGKIKLWAE